jgi:hypothetical protein
MCGRNAEANEVYRVYTSTQAAGTVTYDQDHNKTACMSMMNCVSQKLQTDTTTGTTQTEARKVYRQAEYLIKRIKN